MSAPIVLEVDPADWMSAALDQIEHLARTRDFITAEDLRAVLCEPNHPGQWGAAFLAASKRRMIVRWDDRPSRVKSRNGGSIKVWTAHPALTRKESSIDCA